MTGRKRRVFDVDLPEDRPSAPETKSALPAARGPMATAIGEAGAALRRRAAIEAEIRAENDALAEELVRLRGLGLIVDLVPLDRIRAAKLTRDRRASSDLALGDLKASLREVGLSNPIRVEPDGCGGYELVQGLRRLAAFRELLAETGDARWSAIPAGILAPGEGMATLYRRMVDENMVREGVSFAEMAMLALAYAEEGVGGCASVDEAVNLLYASAGAQKRSYVRRFALLMTRLGKVIEHPTAISRAIGLDLADRIEADPEAQAELDARLRRARGGAEAELAAMRAFLAERAGAPKPAKRRGALPSARRRAVRIDLPDICPGAFCTALGERIELRLPGRDLAGADAPRLRAAVAAFLDALDG